MRPSRKMAWMNPLGGFAILSLEKVGRWESTSSAVHRSIRSQEKYEGCSYNNKRSFRIGPRRSDIVGLENSRVENILTDRSTLCAILLDFSGDKPLEELQQHLSFVDR